jgi:hypothetical protein
MFNKDVAIDTLPAQEFHLKFAALSADYGHPSRRR